MANELTTIHGSYASIISSAAVTGGAVSGESSSVATALSATEEIYAELDFKLLASTAHTAGDTVDVYRRASDGTNASPAVTLTHLHQYVGSITMNGTVSTYYYLYGVQNVDPEDTFYFVNNSATTITFVLSVRGRTYQPAA